MLRVLRRALCVAIVVICGPGRAIGQQVGAGSTAANATSAIARSDNSAHQVVRVMRMGFGDGSATLFNGGKQRLDSLAADVGRLGVTRIIAVGHTSDRPVPRRSRSMFPDNHKLSYSRASVVAGYLAEVLHVPTRDVVVFGRGPEEPLASNATESGRNLNERIELLFEVGFEAIPVRAQVPPHPIEPVNLIPDLTIAESAVSAAQPVTYPAGDQREAVDTTDASTAQRARSPELPGGSAKPGAFVFDPDILPDYAAGEKQALTTELSDGEPVVDGMTAIPSTGIPNVYRDLGHLPGFTGSVSGRFGAGYTTNVFEQSVDSVASMMLQSSLTAEMLYEPESETRIAIWATGFASPYVVESAPVTVLGRGGVSVSHRFSGRLVGSLAADGRIESDDVVNKEGEDPRRDFAHFAARFQPSLQLAAGRRGSISIVWNTEWVDFNEQADLVSLDYWRYGPSLRFRTRMGQFSDLRAEYAFRVQNYDAELAALRTGEERPTNPVERHNFDRFSVNARIQPVEAIAVLAGYGFERKDDRYVGFESWTDYAIRAGLESTIGKRLTVGLGVKYNLRRYDNRLGDGQDHLHYELVVLEGSFNLQLIKNLSLYATARSANRDTNRSFGNEYRDFQVSQIASGIAFSY